MNALRPIWTVAFVLCVCSAVSAQHRGGGGVHPQAHSGKPGRAGVESGPRPVEEFMRMSPAEREKALQNLPADRQEKLRQQLQRYDQLPPERKAQLQRLWQLSPEKQQKVRNSVRDFAELPEERRQSMRQQLQNLEPMSADERKKYFKSSEFKQQYSHEEQDIIKNMSEIMPPA